jgi:hypothetical protein
MRGHAAEVIHLALEGKGLAGLQHFREIVKSDRPYLREETFGPCEGCDQPSAGEGVRITPGTQGADIVIDAKSSCGYETESDIAVVRQGRQGQDIRLEGEECGALAGSTIEK